jgi:hypothetical protein
MRTLEATHYSFDSVLSVDTNVLETYALSNRPKRIGRFSSRNAIFFRITDDGQSVQAESVAFLTNFPSSYLTVF